ncbi:hypothetical protein GWI33_017221 [Rhynchophorus ferrugineus]|uniref:Uncharacterized protein n=1 Tax=Rhynchophorus ferrugineus TaxID=354439 RepID=A0A834HZA9_RHYFE|nr:hypothetical protein GWI33_017221 [Rhynchophorus ferrugineus]
MESNYGEVGGWPRFEAKPTLSRRLRTRNLLLSTTPAARWQTGVSLGIFRVAGRSLIRKSDKSLQHQPKSFATPHSKRFVILHIDKCSDTAVDERFHLPTPR